MANFTVNAPFMDMLRRCEAAKLQIKADNQQIVELIGVQVLSMAQRDYRTLSRRGTSSDGRVWRELHPKTIARKLKRGRKTAGKVKNVNGQAIGVGAVAIGIDTGLQFASGVPKAAGNIFRMNTWEITVGYGRSYSQYFDELRKLMPDVLPEVWRRPLEKTFGKWLQGIVSKFVGGKNP